jgi:adenine phosphoribosyltransferase
VAYQLKKSFVPIRKAGKLPRPTIGLEYTIEYGKAKIEIIKKDIKPGARVLIIDDLLATGGTVIAAIKLIRQLRATPVAAIFVINLPDLPGKKNVEKTGVSVQSIIDLPGK